VPLTFADLRFDRYLPSACVLASQRVFTPDGRMYVFYREDAGGYRCIYFPESATEHTRVWMGLDPLVIQCMLIDLELSEKDPSHDPAKGCHARTPG
jgi:hypothetical protein